MIEPQFKPLDHEFVELEDCYIGSIDGLILTVHHEGEVFRIPKAMIEKPEQFHRWDNHVTVAVREYFARRMSII